MEYQVVRGEDFEQLRQRVEARMAEDWRPQGGVAAVRDEEGNQIFVQAMVRVVTPNG